MAPLKGLLVDVGGTLVRDETWVTRERYQELMVDRLAEAYGGGVPPWAFELIDHAFRVEDAPEELTPVRQQIAAFLNERGHTATLDEIDRFCRACALPLPEVVEVDPDALAAMRSARRLGLRIAICSNTFWRNDSDAQRDWAEFGFGGCFDAFVTSHSTGVGKPHARIFERAMGLIGVEADEAAIVGDQLPRDVAGGKAAGLRTIWKRPDWHKGPVEPQPDATISSLDQLEPILRRWVA